MPAFKYMERYIAQAKLIGVDETYWSCREKQRLKDNSSVEDTPKSKSQRSKSKMCRTYVFSIITQKVCLYYHSLERNSDIPKHILLDNEISKDCFVVFDAFYRNVFSIKADKDGKEQRFFFCHGICWIHARRNFCELINYATHKNGNSVADMVKNSWEQDIKDSKELVEAITSGFNVYNEQGRKRISNSKLDIVKLRISMYYL